MIIFVSSMMIAQLVLMSILFPFMKHDDEQWLKTVICSLILTWIVLLTIFKTLGPGYVEKES